MNEQPQQLVLDERHESRRVLVQAQYAQTFFPEESLQHFIDQMFEEFPPVVWDKELLRTDVERITKHREELDRIIRNAAPERALDQISRIDLVILRLAVVEMKYVDQVPLKVAINEAVELAKEFGGDASYKFVNGTLGTIARSDEIPK